MFLLVRQVSLSLEASLIGRSWRRKRKKDLNSDSFFGAELNSLRGVYLRAININITNV